MPITKKIKHNVKWNNAEYKQLGSKRTKYYKLFQKSNDICEQLSKKVKNKNCN